MTGDKPGRGDDHQQQQNGRGGDYGNQGFNDMYKPPPYGYPPHYNNNAGYSSQDTYLGPPPTKYQPYENSSNYPPPNVGYGAPMFTSPPMDSYQRSGMPGPARGRPYSMNQRQGYQPY